MLEICLSALLLCLVITAAVFIALESLGQAKELEIIWIDLRLNWGGIPVRGVLRTVAALRAAPQHANNNIYG